MKKLLALILCVLMALALAACTGEPEPSTQATTTAPTETTVPDKGPFLVGYGRVNINPENGVHLAGSTNPETRVSEGILDDIYATCIALTDADGETLLLYHMDLQRADQYAAYARLDLSKEFDIPIENIIISATHTHAAPNTQYYLNEKYPRVTIYMDEILFPAIMEAGRQALEDRKPAELYGASTELTNMGFNKHYLLDDGSVAGDLFGNFSGRTIIRHMIEADNQMQVLCFKREGGKDVVMVNWQSHPHKNGNTKPYVSSDFIGPLRDYLEAELDCNFAYFTGASGNLNSGSRISSEVITADYIEHGQELGRYALMALDNMEKLELGQIEVATAMSHASKTDMPVSAFSIGDVGFVVAPYEMFSENGEFIKDNSPYEYTFVVTCANGKFGYFPSEATYAYESYEQRANNIPQGNAEEVANTFVDLLTGLYPDRYLPGTTEIAERTYEGPLYWNLDRGIERVKKIDGSYDIRFLVDGEVVEYRLTNRNLLARIDAQDLMGLTLEDNKIVGVHSLLDMPYERITTAYYVESVSGQNVVLNSHTGMKGRQVTVTLDDSVKMWDVVNGCELAEPLSSKHRVTAVTDEDGKLLSLYVTVKGASAAELSVLKNLESSEHYCENCQKDVTFYHWTDTAAMPNVSAHFLLTVDVAPTGTQRISGGEVCVDLNGKTVTMQTESQRIYSMAEEATLVIQDSVGTGVMKPADGMLSGLIIQCEHEKATFKLYGGTLDASESVAQYSNAVYMKSGRMEMYGGTIKGGETYGSGSGCMAVGAAAEFEMFGGTFEGGYCKTKTITASDPSGGGIMRVSGVAIIHDGQFIGGSSDYNGGNLYVKTGATLKLLGGTITGGACAGKDDTKGAGLFLEAGCEVVLGGDVNITGNTGSNFYVTNTATIKIDTAGLSDAKIGVSGQEGVFLKGTFTEADLACFVSDDPSMKVVLAAEGIALEKN